MRKYVVVFVIIFNLLSVCKMLGLCQTNYYCVDRGSGFKVLYLDFFVSEFELESIIRDIVEDMMQFQVREREYTIDVYVEKEYWMTVRYSIQTGLKIIRRN